MNRALFLELASQGLRMPIGAHLVLQQYADPDGIVHDGRRLADVIIETARRFGTPLAVPLMDLALEKAAVGLACGVPPAEVETFHFSARPVLPQRFTLTARMRTTCAAIVHVAKQPDLLPIGMAIGPFSLMTKLVSDPITPVYLAAAGASAVDEPEVALIEDVLFAAEQVVTRYVDAQVDAGAKAVLICEPAANTVYFSPNQLAESYATFDRYVMAALQRLRQRLTQRDVDLILHDCGELTDRMVERFGALGAVMLSFGSSRELWSDAARVPKDTVLYGNLPTKRFYTSELTVGEVEEMATQLIGRMHETGHPFILGSECDVLSVAGREEEILGKVDAFMACGCGERKMSCTRFCAPLGVFRGDSDPLTP